MACEPQLAAHVLYKHFLWWPGYKPNKLGQSDLDIWFVISRRDHTGLPVSHTCVWLWYVNRQLLTDYTISSANSSWANSVQRWRWYVVDSSQASLSTRRSSHVPSDTTSRLHGRDSNVGSTSGRSYHQQHAERRKSSKDVITGAVPGSESLFSSMPPSLAAAFELPGIHISRIETLDFEDDAVSRYANSSAHTDWWIRTFHVERLRKDVLYS